MSQVVEAGTAEHDVAIDYNIDIPPRFCVYADPDHMLRVLENLSRNAAQALMAKGATEGRPKAIRFAAIRTDGLALVEISDTGPGFPADQSERIFEPFHKSTSDVAPASGSRSPRTWWRETAGRSRSPRPRLTTSIAARGS